MKSMLLSIAMVAISSQASAGLNCTTVAAATISQNLYYCSSYNDQNACNSVCAAFPQSAPAATNTYCPPATPNTVYQCTNEQLENARNEGRRQILRDMAAEAEVTMQNYGTSEQNCRRRAELNASTLNRQAIDACNSKASYHKQCQVAGAPEIAVSPAVAPSVTGTGSFKHKWKKPELEGQQGAIAAATQDALNRCRQAVGEECTIQASSTSVSCKKDKKMFDDDERKCSATVVAIPPSSVQWLCVAKVRAINRP